MLALYVFCTNVIGQYTSVLGEDTNHSQLTVGSPSADRR